MKVNEIKNNYLMIEMTEEEALSTIRSLINQISHKDSNGVRLESKCRIQTKVGEEDGYFSIGIVEFRKDNR